MLKILRLTVLAAFTFAPLGAEAQFWPVATMGVTPIGVCPTAVAVPAGLSCYCATYVGPVSGIAR